MRDARHVVVDMSDEGVDHGDEGGNHDDGGGGGDDDDDDESGYHDHDDEGGDYDASSITTPSDQIYKCVGDPSGSTSPP